VIGREWVLVLRDTRPFQACYVSLADIHVPTTKPALRHPLTEPFVAFAFSDDLGSTFQNVGCCCGAGRCGWLDSGAKWARPSEAAGP
jgi:hypothetical protein